MSSRAKSSAAAQANLCCSATVVPVSLRRGNDLKLVRQQSLLDQSDLIRARIEGDRAVRAAPPPDCDVHDARLSARTGGMARCPFLNAAPAGAPLLSIGL